MERCFFGSCGCVQSSGISVLGSARRQTGRLVEFAEGNSPNAHRQAAREYDRNKEYEMYSPDTDRQQIAALVEDYRLGFETLDMERLKSIWDREYPNIIYVPQEKAQPVRGWAGIETYYAGVARVFRNVTLMEIGDLLIDVLGDVALAFFTYRFEGRTRQNNEPFPNTGRNTLVFHRTDGKWKAIHYHESTTGPY